MYNDGLFYKQQQFLAIIKDFELYDKYANNQNIIIAGSLKFNIYQLKMTNILTEINMAIINKYITKKMQNKQVNKLKNYNELKKYLNKIINYYNKNKNIKTKNKNIKTKNNNIKNIKKQNKNIKNIKSIIKKYNKKYENIKNLLDEFRKNLKMNITNISIHENNYTGTISSFNPFIAKSQRIFESASRRLSPSVKKTAASISFKKN